MKAFNGTNLHVISALMWILREILVVGFSDSSASVKIIILLAAILAHVRTVKPENNKYQRALRALACISYGYQLLFDRGIHICWGRPLVIASTSDWVGLLIHIVLFVVSCCDLYCCNWCDNSVQIKTKHSTFSNRVFRFSSVLILFINVAKSILDLADYRN